MRCLPRGFISLAGNDEQPSHGIVAVIDAAARFTDQHFNGPNCSALLARPGLRAAIMRAAKSLAHSGLAPMSAGPPPLIRSALRLLGIRFPDFERLPGAMLGDLTVQMRLETFDRLVELVSDLPQTGGGFVRVIRPGRRRRRGQYSPASLSATSINRCAFMESDPAVIPPISRAVAKTEVPLVRAFTRFFDQMCDSMNFPCKPHALLSVKVAEHAQPPFGTLQRWQMKTRQAELARVKSRKRIASKRDRGFHEG